MNRKLGEMGFIHDAILQVSILRFYWSVLLVINSKLSFWVIFDFLLDVENTFVCLLTLDDLTLK